MKKIVLVLIFLLVAASLFADIQVGGAFGLNRNSHFEWESSSKAGFEVGAFANIYLSRIFSIQPEFNFIYFRVGREIWMGGLQNGTATYRFFEIPVLAKFNFGDFSVFLGPAMQIILGDINVEWNGGSSSFPPYNRSVFGAIAGIGYALPVGNGDLIFDLRFRLIGTHERYHAFPSGSTIGFRVGYAFWLW
ncbi:MAG: PorT family protein [Spirochaetes bacterium]|nr:PorT family protein [Spirochaetota bacterium]